MRGEKQKECEKETESQKVRDGYDERKKDSKRETKKGRQ